MSDPKTTSGALSVLIEEIIKVLPYVKPIPNFISEIFYFIPEMLKIRDSIKLLYFKNITAIVVLILCIVTMNDRAHDQIFSGKNNVLDGSGNQVQLETDRVNNKTPEGILFILFILLIIMFTINTIHVAISNQYGSVDDFTKGFSDKLTIPASKMVMYIINFILVAVFVSIIAGVTNKKSLALGTSEAIVFAVFLTLIMLVIIHTIYIFFKKDVKGWELPLYAKSLFFDLPLNLIIFFFSLLLWFVYNLPKLITGFFNGIYELIINIFTGLGKMLNDPEETKTLYKYGLLYAVIFAVIIIMYYATFDPTALTSSTFTYIMMIIVPLILVLYIVTPFSIKQGSGATMFIIGTVVTFFVALMYFYMKATSATYELMNYVVIIILIAIAIIGLAIIFYILSNYLKSLTGWTGFMVYLIFYLPCLFIDFVKYIMDEFKMTANPIFVILIIELIVVILYFYLPAIVHSINKSTNKALLPGSAFLDIRQVVGNSEMNKIPKMLKNQNDLDDNLYNQNYAFSMWIYLNPQAPNYIGYASESTIFSYNEDDFGGKPKITYFNDMTKNNNSFGKTGIDQYCVYFSNRKNPVGQYKFSMPSQKWNNLVINFKSSQADLFVNGKLEYTYMFGDNLPQFSAVDYATIGQDKGLDGAICNVVYYPKNLSLIEIANNYNILSLRNPPTFR